MYLNFMRTLLASFRDDLNAFRYGGAGGISSATVHISV